MASTINDIMTKNPRTLTSDSTVAEAASCMSDLDIGDILVTEKDGQLCGVVTDRDIVVRVLAEHKDPERAKVGDICSRDLITLKPSSSIEDAVRTMAGRSIRRIPVVKNGKPVGIVSLGDLARARDPRSALGTISNAPPNN